MVPVYSSASLFLCLSSFKIRDSEICALKGPEECQKEPISRDEHSPDNVFAKAITKKDNGEEESTNSVLHNNVFSKMDNSEEESTNLVINSKDISEQDNDEEESTKPVLYNNVISKKDNDEEKSTNPVLKQVKDGSPSIRGNSHKQFSQFGFLRSFFQWFW